MKIFNKILFSLAMLLFLMATCVGLSSLYYYQVVLREDDKVKIIVADNNKGQLCNQLWHFAHLAAFCKERGYELYNPAFFHYAKYFEYFHDDALISPSHAFRMHLPHVQEVHRRIYRILRHLLKNHFLENRFYCTSPENPLILPPSTEQFPPLKKGNYFFFDWNFANPVGLEKHGAYLREILKPKAKYCKNIDKFWQKIDKKRLCVGVHIRHRDYRTWSNGAFFFSIEQIKEHMKKFQERYASLNPMFIIYCDEERSVEEFTPFDVKISQGNSVEDLYSMAKCDLIMGVGASTYNGWAAWYGEVPRYKYEEEPHWNNLDAYVSKLAAAKIAL